MLQLWLDPIQSVCVCVCTKWQCTFCLEKSIHAIQEPTIGFHIFFCSRHFLYLRMCVTFRDGEAQAVWNIGPNPVGWHESHAAVSCCWAGVANGERHHPWSNGFRRLLRCCSVGGGEWEVWEHSRVDHEGVDHSGSCTCWILFPHFLAHSTPLSPWTFARKMLACTWGGQ